MTDAKTDTDATKSAEKPGKKSTPRLLGLLGFILSLGAGYVLGQYFMNRKEVSPVQIQDGPRFNVDLRGDEPQRGPDDALVTLIEFADYQCGYCAQLQEPLHDALSDFDENDVRLIYKHYPLPFHKRATPAAKGAWAAAQQGKFWAAHELLFDAEADVTVLLDKAGSLGLDPQRLREDLESEAAAQAVSNDLLSGSKIGVRGTPVVFVNGHRYVGLKPSEHWRQIIESELKTASGLVSKGTARADVYAELMKGALKKGRRSSPDPSKVYQITVDDRPALGPDDALVTIVEFSDFQCPFCAKVAPRMRQLVQQNDDVRVVFRNLPLPMHDRAEEAAKAAAAAGQQGRFWDMHDLLFDRSRELGDADFSEFAEQLGLDTEKFEADLGSSEVAAMVAEDEAMAKKFKISSTPVAFINGRYVSGALEVDAYQALVDKARTEAQALVQQGTQPAEVYAKLMESAAVSVSDG